MVAKGCVLGLVCDLVCDCIHLWMYEFLFFSHVYKYRPAGLFLHLQMPRYGYCFTLNNYTDEDEQTYMSIVGSRGVEYIIFGRETAPSTGTKHLQGYMQVNHDKTARLNQHLPCKKHVRARGDWQSNYNYCTKGGDFYEAGEADKDLQGIKQGKRSDLAAVKDAIMRGETYDEICDAHFEEAAKYHRFIREQITRRDTTKELNSLREAYESASLRPWQAALVDIVQEDPNPRKIHWIWEGVGNTGKSWMTKYLAAMYGACIMTVGKKVDMSHLYSKNPSRIVVFDLSRTTAPGEGREHFLDGAYSLAEDLKNGLVTSYKYDSSNILKEGCHVIFFANFLPDMTKWSEDRYLIKEI